MRYCEGCWAGRKSWLPDRPKPRSRRQRDARREWRLQQRRDRRQFKHGSSDEMDGKDAGRARSDSDSGFFPQELDPDAMSIEGGKGTPGSGSPGVPGEEPAITMQPTPLCMMCYQRPKNASLIHGRIGHQVRLQPPFFLKLLTVLRIRIHQKP